MKIFKLKELKVHMFICYERLDEFQARRKNSGGGGLGISEKILANLLR